MPRRWGLGPVFVYESLVGARRWQVYAGRSSFVLVMLAGMAVVWLGHRGSGAAAAGGPSPTLQQSAEIGREFFYTLACIQVALVLLAAPAATAGSICMDRARGSLLHLMVTDLSDAEIVVGKLASRLAPVFGLIACALPVTALAGLLGGIDFVGLAGAFAVALALGVLGCTLALGLSVFATRMHEVLVATYALLILWLLALPIWWWLSQGTGLARPPEWFELANPFVLVVAPYERPARFDPAAYVAFVAAALGLSATLTLAIIATLRRAVVAQSGRAAAPARRRLPGRRPHPPSLAGPSLDGNPVLWREWHRNRPTPILRRVWAILLVLTWALTAWGTYDLFTEHQRHAGSGIAMGLLIQVVFGMLMLSAMSPTVLAEERVRGGLDVLLATPLSTRSIVVGKWWGAYRRVLLLGPLVLYALVMLAATTPEYTPPPTGFNSPRPLVPLTNWDRACAGAIGLCDFLVSGAGVVSLGVALATWVPRLGRALVISVSLYLLAGIGWIFLAEFAWSNLWGYGSFEDNRYLLGHLLALSPLAGTISPLDILSQPCFTPRAEAWAGFAIVILVKLLFAAGLLGLSIATFDGCLGRVPETRRARGGRKPEAPGREAREWAAAGDPA